MLHAASPLAQAHPEPRATTLVHASPPALSPCADPIPPLTPPSVCPMGQCQGKRPARVGPAPNGTTTVQMVNGSAGDDAHLSSRSQARANKVTRAMANGTAKTGKNLHAGEGGATPARHRRGHTSMQQQCFKRATRFNVLNRGEGADVNHPTPPFSRLPSWRRSCAGRRRRFERRRLLYVTCSAVLIAPVGLQAHRCAAFPFRRCCFQPTRRSTSSGRLLM